MNKKTKIVATLSDLRCDVEYIRSLYEAGMNAVRINTAHASFEGAEKILRNTREVSDQIAVIIDTKGPEIRVSSMAPKFERGIEIKTGDTVKIQGKSPSAESTDKMLYVSSDKIHGAVPVGSRILIDDGDLELVVTKADETTITTEVMNSGVIKAHKSINIPGVKIDLPSVSEKDKDFILWGIEHDIDFIAHSFVRHKEDVLSVKSILREHNSPIKIIAKIENREGVTNIDDILVEAHGVMVARGDLGVEIPYEEIPVTQRYIVKKCIESKTPVIIATQMLHSMIHSPKATRAEISDVASAIYQKVDAIMLSGETAIGEYPVEAVTTMTKVAMQIERDIGNYSQDVDINLVRINNEVTAQLARSAVRATVNLPIKAIVVDTLSGRTARYLSAFRGRKPVYVVCYRKSVMRQLALSYGIHAIYQEPVDGPQNFLLSVLYYLQGKKWLFKEDMIVALGGSFGAAKGASFIEIGNVLNLQHKALNEVKRNEQM